MFSIKNNIAALSAFNDVSNVSNSLNKSMGKLSKGLRIAEAGDDPAGLVSSELFRSHITSMDAAIRNNNEAINYSKTAENSLGEMSKLLTEARGLVIAAGNTATLSATQLAANQEQLNSIIGSINRISAQTSYGNRKLLDGSAGVTTQISNATKVSGIQFGGSAGTASITLNGLISLQQTVVATRALYTATSALSTGALQTGSFSINGVSFNVTAGTGGQAIANQVNAASAQAGVTAIFDATTFQLRFQQTGFGTNKSITFSDTTGVISTAASTNSLTTGVNAVANVNFGSGNVLYTGGQQGADGLSLRDANGNAVQLNEAGNAVSALAAVGRVIAGESTFQIGHQSGNTANLALRNMSALQLGTGVATGVTMNNITVDTSPNASTALRVIDKAVEEVSQMRGRIGNFQRNSLESQSRNLQSMKENLTASESSIRDLDVASEMTNYTKLQVMQQAGMAMLGQANQSGQSVLSLLRG